MFANYLKTAIRHLLRHKTFSVINIAGLSISMSACILIMLFVSFELSYDRFHVNGDDIYRITLGESSNSESTRQRAKVYGFIGPALELGYPEVLSAVRLINLHGIMGNYVMSYEDVSFSEERLYYTDASFLEMFSFRLIEGDADQALSKPFTTVITESTAKRYFGDESPLGKTIVVRGNDDYEVTGVLEDIPENSHLKFEFLFSFETIKSESYMLSWADFFTFVQLAPGTSPTAFNEKLLSSSILEENIGPELASSSRLSLQPLHDIHLYSDLEGEAEFNGSSVVTYGLASVAILILLIAWVNYINLAISQSLDRAKEVGIRKVSGAEQNNVIGQFLIESLLLNTIALVVAVLLARELLPAFNSLAETSLVFSMYGRSDLWLFFLSIILLVGLLSNLYPAISMASFRPVNVLKGQLRHGRLGTGLRKGLVVYQFVASIVLVSTTWAVYQQVSFMRQKELGIDISRTLVVKGPSVRDSTFSDRFVSFKNELLRQTSIESITAATNIPGRESTWGGAIRRVGDASENSIDVDNVGIDYDYIEAYSLKILAGRNFARDFTSDLQAVLINEAACQGLGFGKPEDILGQALVGWRRGEYRVVGVVQNHHQLSLRHAQIPTIYYLRPIVSSFCSIKFRSDRVAETIDLINEEYTKAFPGNPFDYFFLDEYFGRQYQSDQRFGRIFGIFSGLTIFIALLGLLSLSSDTASKRTKEIGIRKVLGASASGVVALLSRDILILIGISIAIALPVAGLAINRLLDNYAYRIDLDIGLFAWPAMIVAMVALMTVGSQALRAALCNPAETLREQ